MNSFQDRIGCKRMRKREIKMIVPFLSYPTRNRKFEKNSKNLNWGFSTSQNRLKKAEKERK